MPNRAEPESGVPDPFVKVKIRPPIASKGKIVQSLFKTDSLSASVQVVASGGETSLHAHAGSEASWIVLSGEAAFYTTDNQLVAKLAKNDILVIPHGTPYWFESASEEPLVVLRVAAKVEGVEDKRIDYTENRLASRAQDAVAGAYFEG
jgi:mannose-6-phosphate isomerase-like protein (cupin superfamily)